MATQTQRELERREKRRAVYARRDEQLGKTPLTPKTRLENGQRISIATGQPYEEPTFTPTVLSDTNIRNKVIPDLNQRASNLYGTPSPYPSVPTGEKVTTAGTPKAPTEKDTTKLYDELSPLLSPGETPELKEDPIQKEYEQMQEDIFKRMETEVSDTAKRQEQNVLDMYNRRRRDLAILQGEAGAQKAGLGQYLFSSGASRYGTVGPTSGLVTSSERSLMNQLSDLRIDENEAIQKVRDAQKKGDWRVMQARLDYADKVRAEKEKRRDELLKALRDQNEKVAEQQRGFNISLQLSDLIQNEGLTDPSQIIRRMNDLGEPITTKEAGDALAVLLPELKDAKDPLEAYSGHVGDFLMLKRDFPDLLPPEIDNPFKYTRYMTDMETKLSATGSKSTSAPVNSSLGRGTPQDISLSSIEEIRNLPVSDLTKAAMSGMIKVKDLTPTDKASVVTEMFNVGYNPQQYVVNKLNGLIALWAAIPKNQKGLIEGFIKPWASYTEPTVATFNSAKEVLTREIARLNDVGMLSDQDVASYQNAMPSRMSDNLAVILGKVAGLAQTITGKPISLNVGKTGTLADGRAFIVGTDGETLLDPETGQPLE